MTGVSQNDATDPQGGGTRVSMTRKTREERQQQAKAEVWRAIWEASQYVALGDLERHCLGTIEEIRGDEP